MAEDESLSLRPTELPSAPDRPRSVVYLGTPALAVAPLVALVEAGYEIPLVVSRPDRRRGRGAVMTPSPVKAEAERLGLTVTDDLDEVLEVEADIGVVVAYGRIIPTRILEALPMVNLHFSLLPRWRGAAPVERAILAGDRETGVCLMGIVPDLDAGSIYDTVRLTIGSDETLDELRERLISAGSSLLVESLAAGLGQPDPQVGDVTYADKITPEDLRLDWSKTADELTRVVRLGNAWTTFRAKRLKVWRATRQGPGEGSQATDSGDAIRPGEISRHDGRLVVGTGEGRLELIEVQPEGKGRMDAMAWANGAQPQPGERLGVDA